jgi:hypothetical protein
MHSVNLVPSSQATVPQHLPVDMRAFFQLTRSILVFVGAMTASLPAGQSYPRPSYMPSTPSGEKAIANYSAADVLGCIITEPSQIPAGHPYREQNFEKGIRASWPGAKIPTQIDSMLQIILDAPGDIPQSGREEQISRELDNMDNILRNVFDLSPESKADALVRVAGKQTDPVKKMRAINFASSFFWEFLDSRLLMMGKDLLDDSTVVSNLLITETKWQKTTRRGMAQGWILNNLNAIGLTVDSKPSLFTDDKFEATRCAALKSWVTANSDLIANKCTEARNKPNRELSILSRHYWDVRWQ